MTTVYHRLLQWLAFSKSYHLAGISFPPISWSMTYSNNKCYFYTPSFEIGAYTHASWAFCAISFFHWFLHNLHGFRAILLHVSWFSALIPSQLFFILLDAWFEILISIWFIRTMHVGDSNIHVSGGDNMWSVWAFFMIQLTLSRLGACLVRVLSLAIHISTKMVWSTWVQLQNGSTMSYRSILHV